MNTTEKIKQLYNKSVLQTYPENNIAFVRGEGSYLENAEGKRYLDFTSGIGVCSLGHCHPTVTKAIQKQAETLMHVSNLFMNEKQAELASLISQNGMNGKVFFANSGAEANEGLIKFARKWGHSQGKFEIITMKNSFHGRTLATLAATGQEKFRQGFQPNLEGFVHVEYGNIDAVEQAITEKTAAILVEPIQGEGGVNVPEENYLNQLRFICDKFGILLMLDEVQTGIGRTGESFAHQHNGIIPDAVSMAKALGNGFPIGAIEISTRYDDILSPGTHATTFGGTPLACAAGIAVWNVIEQENILEQCKKTSEFIFNKLEEFQKKYSKIKNIRGKGLLIGIEVEEKSAEIRHYAFEKNLLLLGAGESVIRLMPPLNINQGDVIKALDILDDAFSANF